MPSMRPSCALPMPAHIGLALPSKRVLIRQVGGENFAGKISCVHVQRWVDATPLPTSSAHPRRYTMATLPLKSRKQQRARQRELERQAARAAEAAEEARRPIDWVAKVTIAPDASPTCLPACMQA